LCSKSKSRWLSGEGYGRRPTPQLADVKGDEFGGVGSAGGDGDGAVSDEKAEPMVGSECEKGSCGKEEGLRCRKVRERERERKRLSEKMN